MANENVFVDQAGLAVYNGLIRGDTTPLEDGSPSTGTSKKFARADHVHPHDSTKVDKVTGKGLSTEDYTSEEKSKLAGITAGAEPNVQADWNATSGDAFIKNKPTIPTGVEKSSTTPKMDGTASAGTETKFAAGDHVHPTDTSRVPTTRTVNGKALSSDIALSASDVGAVPTTAKGAAGGVCDLDSNGLVPTNRLPGYVDDVVEAYPRTGQTELGSAWLATGSASGTVITPETGKIYILMAASTSYNINSQFRWGGTQYVKLNDGGIRAITAAEIEAIVNS